MDASGRPGMLKLYRPAMKSAFLMSCVVARNPAVLTTDEGPNRIRRLVRKVEENAPVVAPEPQPADVEIAFARADDRIAQSGFCVEASRAVVQELELFRSGVSESIACGGEVGQAFTGQDLPAVRGV